MPKKEESREEPKKKKGFFNSTFFVILLFLITAAVVAINRYDRKHRDEIHVTVDKNLVKETVKDEEVQNKNNATI